MADGRDELAAERLLAGSDTKALTVSSGVESSRPDGVKGRTGSDRIADARVAHHGMHALGKLRMSASFDTAIAISILIALVISNH